MVRDGGVTLALEAGRFQIGVDDFFSIREDYIFHHEEIS